MIQVGDHVYQTYHGETTYVGHVVRIFWKKRRGSLSVNSIQLSERTVVLTRSSKSVRIPIVLALTVHGWRNMLTADLKRHARYEHVRSL